MKIFHLLRLFFVIIINYNVSLATDNALRNFEHFLLNNTPVSPFLEWLKRRPTKRPAFQNIICNYCSCGVLNGKRKIVGGSETKVNQYPWMAMLLYNNQFYCGGSLINDRYILTAAHCVRGFIAHRIVVRLLMHERTLLKSGAIERRVKRATVHNSYNSRTFDNDIALLSLSQSVPINNQVIRPICLPNPNESLNAKAIVLGWGATSANGPLASTLQEIEISVINSTECGKKLPITSNMICAGTPDGQKDSCQGDSGGPLMTLNENSYAYTQIGIVSWGIGCGLPDKPGVYTFVQNYVDWIQSNTKDACYC